MRAWLLWRCSYLAMLLTVPAMPLAAGRALPALAPRAQPRALCNIAAALAAGDHAPPEGLAAICDAALRCLDRFTPQVGAALLSTASTWAYS